MKSRKTIHLKEKNNLSISCLVDKINIWRDCAELCVTETKSHFSLAVLSFRAGLRVGADLDPQFLGGGVHGRSAVPAGLRRRRGGNGCVHLSFRHLFLRFLHQQL